uniref:Uncharacterized protein n=1 Tax=Spongospora subterranea TaxID=70186 RepID=A0A0H5R726_9EUKA|eukprot:CRZ09918.1 hypothetical protein [Spongospora subterranea]
MAGEMCAWSPILLNNFTMIIPYLDATDLRVFPCVSTQISAGNRLRILRRYFHIGRYPVLHNRSPKFWMRLYMSSVDSRPCPSVLGRRPITCLRDYIGESRKVFIQNTDHRVFRLEDIRPFTTVKTFCHRFAFSATHFEIFTIDGEQIIIDPNITSQYANALLLPGHILQIWEKLYRQPQIAYLTFVYVCRGEYTHHVLPFNRLSHQSSSFNDPIADQYPSIARYLHSGRPWLIYRNVQKVVRDRTRRKRGNRRSHYYSHDFTDVNDILEQLDNWLSRGNPVPRAENVASVDLSFPSLYWWIRSYSDTIRHEYPLDSFGVVFFLSGKYWIRLYFIPVSPEVVWPSPVRGFQTLYELFTELNRIGEILNRFVSDSIAIYSSLFRHNDSYREVIS